MFLAFRLERIAFVRLRNCIVYINLDFISVIVSSGDYVLFIYFRDFEFAVVNSVRLHITTI